MMRGAAIAAPPPYSPGSQEERDDMCQIIHHYLRLDDDGTPTVEVETRHTDEPEAIADHVRAMIAAPGGRSGTTVSLVVSRDTATGI